MTEAFGDSCPRARTPHGCGAAGLLLPSGTASVRCGGSLEAIPDAIPGGSWGELFDDHQSRSTVIALMQVAVEGAGEGFGIVGNE